MLRLSILFCLLVVTFTCNKDSCGDKDEEVRGRLCELLKLRARRTYNNKESCREKYGVWIGICKAFKSIGLLYPKTGLCDCYYLDHITVMR